MSGRIECDGGPHCQASPHVHGCFADRGDCDDREEHPLDRLAALERVAEAARQYLDTGRGDLDGALADLDEKQR